MALNFGKLNGDENQFSFEQSNKASLGITKQQRVETASLVVALDGTGDFETIQEAIDSLTDSGGYIQIKEGTFETTATITLKKNVILSGTGRNTIIKSVGSQTNIINFPTASESIIIERLKIIGTNTTPSSDNSENGINITAGVECRISQCYFESQGTGINGTVSRSAIINNSFTKCFNGIDIGADVSSISNNIIDYDAGGTNGIIVNGDYSSINNNTIFQNGNTGITAGTTLTNSTVIGNALDESTNILISGDLNIVSNNTCRLITLDASSLNNLCQTNLTDLTIVDSGTTNTVANNKEI